MPGSRIAHEKAQRQGGGDRLKGPRTETCEVGWYLEEHRQNTGGLE